MKSLGPALSGKDLKLTIDSGGGVLRPTTGGDHKLRLGRFDGLVVETSVQDVHWGSLLVSTGFLAVLYTSFSEGRYGSLAVALLAVLVLLMYLAHGRVTLFVVGLSEQGTIQQRLIVDAQELASLTGILADPGDPADPD